MKAAEPIADYAGRLPAPPEAVALATELVRRFAECFWFRQAAAGELRKCLCGVES